MGSRRYPFISLRKRSAEGFGSLSIQQGGRQVEYEDQDPRIHRKWLDAIDQSGVKSDMADIFDEPKIRAMEIIAELEPETRGAYAGGVGYFSPNGDMDSCIVLRTAVVKDGMMHVQAGAGIVADSNPEYEQRECEAKAGALIAAAREAFRVAGEAKFGQ